MSKTGGYTGPLEQVGPCQWRIPKSYRDDMRVDGLIFADEALIEQIKKDQGPEQVANVATLPGIQKASLAMPDIHWGYGFAIGGVAATDPEEGGVISPGGVGYDINCGVRLLRSDLNWDDVKPRIRELWSTSSSATSRPASARAGNYKFDKPKLTQLMEQGARVRRRARAGAPPRDLQFTEAGGRLDGAEPDRVSDRAYSAGLDQCGTLGSGNHFLEVQVVDRVLDDEAAARHGPARGADHRPDPLRLARAWAIRSATTTSPPSGGAAEVRLHACPTASSPAPRSAAPRGRRTWGRCAPRPTIAWCNRQLLTHQAREVFGRGLRRALGGARAWTWSTTWRTTSPSSRTTTSAGRRKQVCVHRKGATRAFPPGHPEIPRAVPGDRPAGDHPRQHGDGQLGPGRPARQHGAVVRHDLPRRRPDDEPHRRRPPRRRPPDRQGARRARHHRPARGHKGLAEEQPAAYKDVDQVVEVVDKAGISKKVARLRPGRGHQGMMRGAEAGDRDSIGDDPDSTPR